MLLKNNKLIIQNKQHGMYIGVLNIYIAMIIYGQVIIIIDFIYKF